MSEKYYEPGKCNINDAEALFKIASGIFFLSIAVALAAALIVFKIPMIYSLTVIFPLWLGSMEFLQVKNRFCATKGIKGYHNSGVKRGKKYLVRITDAENRQLDRAKSFSIIWNGLAVSSVLTVCYVVVLNFYG